MISWFINDIKHTFKIQHFELFVLREIHLLNIIIKVVSLVGRVQMFIFFYRSLHEIFKNKSHNK